MKIFVLADTHIPDRAKDLPIQFYEKAKDIDLILHAGDFTEFSVLEKLKKIAKVKAVYGNMDSLEIRKHLPLKEIIQAGKFKIGLVHGEGPPDRVLDYVKLVFEETLDCIIFGHTHNAFNEKQGETLFFNPGSPTDKIFSAYNSFGVLEINEKINAKIIKI